MHAGDVVWNPLSGEKAVIVQSADESGGARLVADFAVEAGGFVPGGEHVHDHCTEHFEVRAGRIVFALDGQERTLEAGDRLAVAPGTPHRWWNDGEDEVQIRVRVEPALRFEEAILTVWGLCTDGHTDARGRPAPLLGALVATRYRREIRYRRPPRRRAAAPVPAAGRGRATPRPRADARSLRRPRDAPLRRGRARQPPRARDAVTRLSSWRAGGASPSGRARDGGAAGAGRCGADPRPGGAAGSG